MSRPAKTQTVAEDNKKPVEKEKFEEKSPEEIASMTSDQLKAYKKKKQAYDRKKESEEAKKEGKIAARIALLETAMKTPVAHNGDLSCDQVDVTFASPVNKVNFVTDARLISYFYKGDLIQLNCHTVAKAKTPCVIVKDNDLYFAQRISDEENTFANLDVLSNDDNRYLVVNTDSEYVGDIVNVIRNPKALFEEAPKGNA